MIEIHLEERKQMQLDILVSLDGFCRKHGLRYYLTAGTLLGAVRHQGYIPWDDDIDIAMPRDDYEQFYRLFNEERGSSSPIRLISYRDKSSIYPFLKAIDGRTVVVEQYVDPRYRTGVWVDIFPLDGLRPGDDSPFKLNCDTQRKYDVIAANPDAATTVFRKYAKRLIRPLYGKYNLFDLAEKLDKAVASTPLQSSNDVGLVIWGYGPRERMPFSILDPTELMFEGRMFYAPKDYDAYLTSIFGDYMTPPPESERIAHACRAFWKDAEQHG